MRLISILFRPICLPALFLALCLGHSPAAAQQKVEVPSLDAPDGKAVRLPGFWFPAAGEGARPTIVMLHGCGGPYDRKGALSVRMRNYARLFNEERWHVLVVDSFTPRGERELCTQKWGSRKVTQAHRRRDSLGALKWLSTRPEVDAARLVLLGWSHGGSAVLASTNARQREVANAAVRPRAAIAFYPGCGADLRRGYRPSVPLLMLLGESDDWTPAESCKQLASRAGDSPPVQVEVYQGAHHGFDGMAPLRLRTDVPNGAPPGSGVHVGGNAQAREASQRRLLAFLHEQLK
jgi:dienelactone hydrolase